MKIFNLLPLAALALLASACSNSSEETATENNTVISETPAHDKIVSDQETEKRERNYKILLEHIKIAPDSVSYLIDINEEEAIKLGIDKEYYQSTAEQIRATNEALKEGIERGDSVELMDFKNLEIPE